MTTSPLQPEKKAPAEAGAPLGRFFIALVFLAALSVGAQEAPAKRWFKGNTHTHTLKSDGDSSPADVTRWYRERGYDFLVITDHDVITDEETTPGFLVIRGEEVTDRLLKKPLHVNGLGMREVVKPQGGGSVVEILQRNVDAVRAAGGVPLINHPNFVWAFGAAELKALKNVALVEIASGHPLVNTEGGGGAPSMEAMWDDVLTSGMRMYGVGVDDSHHFQCGSTDRYRALPGLAWVVVRAESLTSAAIVGAMDRGDFYASTGVMLDDIVATDKTMTIKIREAAGAKYTTEFIGRGGRVLRTTFENPAIYRIAGDQPYIRARVVDSNGRKAWIQPVFRKR